MDMDEYKKMWAEHQKWCMENKVGNYKSFLPKEEQEKLNEEYKRDAYIHSDKVNSLENDEATVLYVITMIVGAIFIDRWIIWIVATVVWLCYINRYAIRANQYDKNHRR